MLGALYLNRHLEGCVVEVKLQVVSSGVPREIRPYALRPDEAGKHRFERSDS